ncbi:hypothetical protein [Streptomyces sp. JNUCC 63]
MKPISAAPVETPKPKARRKAASKPKARKAKAAPAKPKETKIHAGKQLLESDQMLPLGTRWARRNRVGALVASVDLWASEGDDGGDRWGAVCITHGTTERHHTHRDAWSALPKSASWCDGCATAAAEKGADK